MGIIAVAACRVAQAQNELMRFSAAGGSPHLGLAGVGPAIAQVVAHRAM